MSSVISAVSTENAPSPRAGIYNQAIIANGFVYTSGFTPVDPKLGKLVEGSVADRAVRPLLTVYNLRP
jgi:enamine deaminase RidA (YjgF/YER057c/UK114 family)